MPAKIIITITEDDKPDGEVIINHTIEGCDIASLRVNELPPALVLGGEMLRLVEEV